MRSRINKIALVLMAVFIATGCVKKRDAQEGFDQDLVELMENFDREASAQITLSGENKNCNNETLFQKTN